MGRSRWARALITTHTLATVVAFVGWVVQRSHGRPATWLEVAFNVINIPVNYSAVATVVVGLAAVALVRRKRVGLLAAVGFQVVGIYLATVEALGFEAWEPLEPWRPTIMTRVLDFASIPAGLGMLWLLWWLRPEFAGRVRKGSWWQAGATLLVGLSATTAVAWGVAEATAPGGADMRAFGAIMARAAGLGSRAQQAILDTLPRWLPGTVGIMVSLSALTAVWVFLRSAHDPNSWELGQERRLRHLIARFGGDSLAYFATRRDKSAVFSPGGEAAVTYRVVQGVCIASGDPVGDPAHWPAAIGVWLAEVHAYGWLPAVMSASEQGAQAYVDAGLRVIRMGDEAVIDERRLAAARAADAQLRRAVRHVAAEGVTVEVRRQRQLSRDDLAEINAVADSWRRGRTERGFSMALGRSDDPSDGRVVHVLARGTDRRPVGLLSFVPWGTGGLSLDVMRRSPDAPHGITEAMVFGLMERSRHIGVRQVSLNFCMFRSVFAESEKFGASNVERLSGSVLGFLDRFWQLERLWNDVAARAQNRSEDLLTRPRALEVLHIRSAVVDAVRTTLRGEGFREMTTPVLHQVHGGASARPFHTHLNAYHQDLSLRVAPELYLKRLLVAGSGPIFEVSRNFRNEGVDATHNPEFTSVEAYRPFADYYDMRGLTEHLVRDAARAATGGTVLEVGGETFDLDGDWPVIGVCDAVSAALGEVVTIDDAPDRLAALAEAVDVEVEVDPEWSAGRIIEELYGELVEPRTTAPTFYVDFPADTSPLTRPHRSLPGLVERWDLVVAGMEIGTAYTELTDPRIQRERLVRQSLAAAAGDVEAMEVDEAFLRALELGMPPSGGLGIGLDRLVMLLTGEQIRGVLSFPFTGPETGNRRQR